MKKFLLAALAVSTLALSAPAVFADDTKGEYGTVTRHAQDARYGELLEVCRRDGTCMNLTGTKESCGSPGARYNQIAYFIETYQRDGGKMNWYIKERCGSYGKVCFTNPSRNELCSAYNY